MRKIIELLRRLYRRFCDTRGEMDIPKITKVKIGNVVYEVVRYFRKESSIKLEDKIYRLMEKELDASDEMCYNNRTPLAAAEPPTAERTLKHEFDSKSNSCYNELYTKAKESLDCEAEAPPVAELHERRAV